MKIVTTPPTDAVQLRTYEHGATIAEVERDAQLVADCRAKPIIVATGAAFMLYREPTDAELEAAIAQANAPRQGARYEITLEGLRELGLEAVPE